VEGVNSLRNRESKKKRIDREFFLYTSAPFRRNKKRTTKKRGDQREGRSKPPISLMKKKNQKAPRFSKNSELWWKDWEKKTISEGPDLGITP